MDSPDRLTWEILWKIQFLSLPKKSLQLQDQVPGSYSNRCPRTTPNSGDPIYHWPAVNWGGNRRSIWKPDSGKQPSILPRGSLVKREFHEATPPKKDVLHS